MRLGAAGVAVALATALLAACSPGPAAGAESAAGTVTASVQAAGDTAASVPAAATRWAPTPGATWQWQLTTPVDVTVAADVFDIDGVESTADTVAALHRAGRKAICYVNAGAVEDFRPDRAAFPRAVQGAQDGWPGERLLDIRRLDVLGPIMAARFDMCRQKGFDAVEADLVDTFAEDSGFPLTAADQLAYNRMLADLAHARGLAIGLKNDLDQVADLVDVFDFAINEQCFQYDECDELTPFVRAHKAVFTAEYELDPADFCPDARARGFSSMRKHLDLDAWRQPC